MVGISTQTNLPTLHILFHTAASVCFIMANKIVMHSTQVCQTSDDPYIPIYT